MIAKYLIAALLALPLLARAELIEQVQVRDADFQIIKILAPAELEQFQRIWSGKNKITAEGHGNWPYKLDISAQNKGNRWLYHPSGLVRVLSKSKVPTYQFSNPGAFNQLLGIPNKSFKADAVPARP